jgi:hypothetical protein
MPKPVWTGGKAGLRPKLADDEIDCGDSRHGYRVRGFLRGLSVRTSCRRSPQTRRRRRAILSRAAVPRAMRTRAARTSTRSKAYGAFCGCTGTNGFGHGSTRSLRRTTDQRTRRIGRSVGDPSHAPWSSALGHIRLNRCAPHSRRSNLRCRSNLR